VCLDIPVSVRVARLVVLRAGNLNLLEAPLREIHISGAKIAAEHFVLQAERSCQGANLATVSGGNIADDLDLPVILLIANSQVTVGRDLLVCLGDGRRDFVRVQVAAGLGMDQTDDVSVSNEPGRLLRVVISISPVGVEEPVIVGI
jgi:hypothetical protein